MTRAGLPAAALGAVWALACVMRLGLTVSISDAAARALLPLDRPGPFWPPLPHLVSTALVALPDPRLGVWLLALASAGAAPLTAALALALGTGRATALVAGLLVAVYPYHVSTASAQPLVGLTVSLMALALLAVARAFDEPALRRLLALVFAVAAAAADRSEAVLLLPPAGLLLAWAQRAKVRAVGLVLVAMVASIAGYAGARGIIYGRFAPFAENGGYNLLIGHNRFVAEYLSRHDIPSLESIFTHHPEVVAGARSDAELRERAVAFARANPGVTLANTLGKARRQFGFRLENADNYGTVKNAAYAAPYAGALLLATLALVRSRGPEARAVRAALVVFLLHGVAPILTHPLIRVRMTVEPLLLIAAASGTTQLFRRAARPSPSQ